MPRIVVANDQSIKEAADLIKAGELVVLPTETVYGLGANALDAQAVAKIFEAKNRPQFNPLIIHVTDMEAAEKYVEMNARARQIASVFWPGPLTLILPRRAGGGISDLVSAGLPTLAVRVPSHKIMQAVMKAASVPIAAPSANASGEPSATTPKHAAESLGDKAPYILAAGTCDVGLESTVLDLSGEAPVILRPGAVTAEDLEPHLGVVKIDSGDHGSINDRPKSPGQLLKHYAPSIPVRLNAIDMEEGEALLAFGSTKFMGLKQGGAVSEVPETACKNLSEEGDLVEAAGHLFSMLRDLDRPEHKAIAVMNIPEIGLGVAINDRLKRAAQG